MVLEQYTGGAVGRCARCLPNDYYRQFTSFALWPCVSNFKAGLKIKQQQDSESLGILWAESDLVFRHTDFGPFHQDTVSDASFVVARKAGIPGVCSHDLRDIVDTPRTRRSQDYRKRLIIKSGNPRQSQSKVSG